MQRWADGGWDNFCEPDDGGEFVLFGDHAFYVRQLEGEIAELEQRLKNSDQDPAR